ncbi:hypothetical protein ES703_58911 [subsurface metagenome]
MDIHIMQPEEERLLITALAVVGKPVDYLLVDDITPDIGYPGLNLVLHGIIEDTPATVPAKVTADIGIRMKGSRVNPGLMQRFRD